MQKFSRRFYETSERDNVIKYIFIEEIRPDLKPIRSAESDKSVRIEGVRSKSIYRFKW